MAAGVVAHLGLVAAEVGAVEAVSRQDFPTRPPYADLPRGFCRFCGKAVSGRRSTWCSDECVEAWWWAQGHQGWARQKVFERDRGVCANCGRDVDRLTDLIWRMLAEASPSWGRDDAVIERGRRRYERFVRHLARHGWFGQYCQQYPESAVATYSPTRQRIPALWEADHIVELADGGPHELQNLQTLCRPCHAAKTAVSARRRAARARGQGEFALS